MLFRSSSLDESLKNKKSAYNKAESAYKTAQQTAVQSKSKVSEVKKQIAELESEVERLSNKAETNSDKNKPSANTSAVSDSMTLTYTELSEELTRRIEKIDSTYNAVICVDRDYHSSRFGKEKK